MESAPGITAFFIFEHIITVYGRAFHNDHGSAFFYRKQVLSNEDKILSFTTYR